MPAPVMPLVYGGIQYRDQDFFTYSLNPTNTPQFASIAAGGVANAILNIEQDSDFRWIKSAFFAGLTALSGNTEQTRNLPEVTVNVQDTGSGRFLMNSPVQLTNLFGTGSLPAILPIDKVFQARATIYVSVANYGAVSVLNLYLSFVGVKMFM